MVAGMFGGVPNIAQAGVAIVPNINPAAFTGALNRGVMPALSAGGAAAGLALGSAIAGGLVASVAVARAAADTFVPFETELTKIVTLVGIARDEVDGFGEAILGLAPAVGRAPQELAEALFFITSAGLRGTEAMEALEVSARAAALGLGETKDIADAVTSAMNAYGSEVLSAGLATDILAAGVRAGKFEADALAGSIGRILPLASEMGVSFDNVVAAVAALSRTGLDANEAITAVRAALSAIQRPTSAAVGALEAAGLSIKDLRHQLESEGLLPTLSGLALALRDSGEGAEAFFGNVRALTGVLALTGSQAEETVRVFEAVAEAAGLIDDAWSDLEGTQAFRRQAAEAERLAILIGEGSEAAEALTRIYEALPGILAQVIPAVVDVGTAVLNVAADAAAAFEALGRISSLDLAVDTWTDTGGLIEFTEAVDQLAVLSPRVQRLGAALVGLGDGANVSEEAASALFREIDKGRSAWDQFISPDRTEQAIASFGELGLTLADVLAIARKGPDDVSGLTRAIVDITGEAPDLLLVAQVLPIIKLLTDGFEAARRAAEQLASVELMTPGQRDPIFGMAEALDTVEQSVSAAVASMGDYGGVVAGLRGPDGSVVVGFDTLREAVEAVAAEASNASSALLELTSPGFAAISALETFTDAYDAAIKDKKITNEERRELLLPFLELQARVDELDPVGALIFRDVVGAAWTELGGDATALFGKGGVLPLAIDDFGNVIASAGPILADNISGWGPYLEDGLVGAFDIRSFSGLLAGRVIAEVGQAEGIIRNHFEIRSPSRRWERLIGAPLADGILAGFDGTIGARLEAMATAAINAAGRAAQAALPPPGTGTITTPRGALTADHGGLVFNTNIYNPTGTPAPDSLQDAGTRAAVTLQLARVVT